MRHCPILSAALFIYKYTTVLLSNSNDLSYIHGIQYATGPAVCRISTRSITNAQGLRVGIAITNFKAACVLWFVFEDFLKDDGTPPPVVSMSGYSPFPSPVAPLKRTHGQLSSSMR